VIIPDEAATLSTPQLMRQGFLAPLGKTYLNEKPFHHDWLRILKRAGKRH